MKRQRLAEVPLGGLPRKEQCACEPVCSQLPWVANEGQAAIEVFVGRLRKKMGVDLIETVRGLGYRIQAPKHAN